MMTVDQQNPVIHHQNPVHHQNLDHHQNPVHHQNLDHHQNPVHHQNLDHHQKPVHPQNLDPESLVAPGRGQGRCRCLDFFLLLSVTFLFAAVTFLTVAGFMLRSRLGEFPPAPGNYDKLVGQTPYPEYKMNKFAFLEAKSAELTNSTMRWRTVHYGSSESVGSHFLFDPELQSLRPQREGTYFLFLHLNVSCTYRCGAGVLTLSAGRQLTCELRLPAAADSTPFSTKCWAVAQLSEEDLLTQMTWVPQGGGDYWKLESQGSGLGMFLVD